MVQILKLLEVLTKAGVEFTLVGGAAAYAHGSTMVTQDLDVCSRMDASNLKRIAKALAPYAPKHRMPPAKPAFTDEQAATQTLKNLYLSTEIGQVDFWGEIKGIGGYDAVDKASVELSMGNFSFKILSIQKLIEAKEAMGRPRDLETVSILKEIIDEQEHNTDS